MFLKMLNFYYEKFEIISFFCRINIIYVWHEKIEINKSDDCFFILYENDNFLYIFFLYVYIIMFIFYVFSVFCVAELIYSSYIKFIKNTGIESYFLNLEEDVYAGAYGLFFFSFIIWLTYLGSNPNVFVGLDYSFDTFL